MLTFMNFYDDVFTFYGNEITMENYFFSVVSFMGGFTLKMVRAKSKRTMKRMREKKNP